VAEKRDNSEFIVNLRFPLLRQQLLARLQRLVRDQMRVVRLLLPLVRLLLPLDLVQQHERLLFVGRLQHELLQCGH
jgi:hypothetical protein